jgi:hypothetical protein
MTKQQQELHDWLKARYDLYLQDKKKHDLLMYVLSDKQADALESAGIERTEIIMRADAPAIIKALENTMAVEQISLF